MLKYQIGVNMSYLDIRISELLTETDAHLLRSSQPLGWLGLSRSLRKGRLRTVVIIIDVCCIVMLIAAIWALVQFFQATEIVPTVKYGLSASILAIMTLQLKLGLMPHIHTERVLRALKRVEILMLAKNHNRSEQGE